MDTSKTDVIRPLRLSDYLKVAKVVALWIGAFLLPILLLGTASAFRIIRADSDLSNKLFIGAFVAVAVYSVLALIISGVWLEPRTKVLLYAWGLGIVIFIGHVLILLSAWLVPGGHPPLAFAVWAVFFLIDLVLIPGMVILVGIGHLQGERKAVVWGGLSYALLYAYLMFGVVAVPFSHGQVEQMITPLEKRLISGNNKYRTRAIKQFSRLNADAQREIINKLLKESKRGVDYYFAMAFKEMNPEVLAGVVPFLVQALEHPDEHVRRQAILALGYCSSVSDEVVPALIRALGDENRSVRYSASSALKEIGSPATPALIELLRGEDKNLQASAARALTGKDPDTKEAVPILLQMLDDSDPDIRLAAVAAIQEIVPTLGKSEEVISKLIQALDDPNGGVRYAAASMLGGIGPAARDAAPGLIAMLMNDGENFRVVAAKGLGRIGLANPEIVSALITALDDPSMSVRNEANHALRRMGTPEAREAIKRLGSGNNR